MAIKKSLQQIVNEILSDMDSEGVNSISETTEAQQVASIVERTFYNLIANKQIPENEQLLKFVPFSNNEYPTFMKYPENIKKVTNVWYMDEGRYKKVDFVEPREFLYRSDSRGEDKRQVIEPVSGTYLYIGTDQSPRYYTSFDDTTLVFNSYDSTTEDSIQASKIRAYGSLFPNFRMEDDYIPECDANFFPLLINEAKSVAFSVLKGTVDAKVDQAARRQRFAHQNDRYNTERQRPWNDYSRGGHFGYRTSPKL